MDSNFSQQISDDEEEEDPHAADSAVKAPDVLPTTYMALYDFNKTDEDEVSFKVGVVVGVCNVLMLLRKATTSWT